jgi:DNA phosphorothioation-dependent restriction protein DptH
MEVWKNFVLIIDELQKISIKSTGELPLDRLMVEGRKFGAGLICSTQLIDFDKNNKLYKQLAQASTRIYFKPALSEIAAVAKILSIGSNLNWKSILKSMGVGCCIVENGSVGDENDKLVKVVAFERLIDVLVSKN